MAENRIAFVINSLSNGGAERLASNLSLQLSRQYEIDFIVNDLQHLDYPYRGNVISLNMPANRNRMGTGYQILTLIRRVRLLRKLRRSRSFAAVISFSEMSNLANVLSSVGKDKTLISFHTSPEGYSSKSWKYRVLTKYILPFCLQRADHTVSCSKEIADELMAKHQLSEERSVVIYNGIDFKRIQSLCKESLPEQLSAQLDKKGAYLLISVGRLTAVKGHTHLIRVVKKLRDDGMNVRLLILGEGELRSDLEKQIHDLGLKNEVIIPGFAENPYACMAQADIVVQPSRHEGFSNVILEALAVGVPCVATDHVTGAREILAPETDYHHKLTDRVERAAYGVLVPVCRLDAEEEQASCTAEELMMADGIRELLTDRELAEHYRAVAVMRAKELDIAAVASQWADLIEGR